MNFNEIFKKRFGQLNEEQKIAVETTQGPVMVIAGPGTGKTEILAARIANILNKKESGANPQNILCLTYTDAGTIAMRKRLVDYIGPEAYKININTFHGFCNDVILQNPEKFSKRELSFISELEQMQYLKEIIDNFPAHHPLFKVSSDSEIKRLKELFRTMKEENWAEEDIEKSAREYLNDLPNREKYIYKRKTGDAQKGDLNQRELKEEKKRIESLIAGSREFKIYQQKLQENGRYDYQDMILWVLNAFKKDKDLLANYQEQYQYILVDEFQDTNGSQNEILNLLTDFWNDPNIFVVGDDDQSIYRFQGANLRNILDFYHKYPSAKIVVLLKNYRSSQNILDLSEKLIEKNSERLIKEIPNLSKDLSAENPEFKNSKIQPLIIEYCNRNHEESAIVCEIEKLKEKNIDLSAVAVIYKEHKQAENIIKICEQKKIPINVKESINILDETFINNILTLLSYIYLENKNPYSAENLLFELLHFNFWNLNAKDIAKIFVKYKKLKKENDDLESFREFISNEENLDKYCNQEVKTKLLHTSNLLEKWISSIANTALINFIETVLTESGILEASIKGQEKIWRLRVLSTFFNFIKDETRKNPKLNLGSLLGNIEMMQSYKIKIPVNKVTFAKSGVNFITAHSSKGLEFKHVFIIGTESDKWDKKGRNTGYKFPDTLTKSNEGDHAEEARRLFYVAMTRAKEHLQISFAKKNENDKEILRSQFIAELLENTEQKAEERNVSDDKIMEYQGLLMQSLPDKNTELIEKDFIDDLLQNYKLSATHLNKYLQCPRTFYYENILRVPSALNEYLSFGNAIHESLDSFFTFCKEQKKFAEKHILLELFKKRLKFYGASFTDEQFKKRLDYGEKTLSEYFDYYNQNWNLNFKTEYSITNASFESIQLSGKLDKIEFIDSNTINVVDYKTGNYQKSKKEKRLQKPNDKNELGGDYWRQIVFYKILIDSEPHQNWQMISGEIDFVEKDQKQDKFMKEKYFITKEDEEFVKKQITETWQKIHNHEFEKGCNDEKCFWCNFVRNN